MITLTTASSNANAPLLIREGPGTNFGNLAPRVSRAATLDGNAVVTHLGYSAGDRTFLIEWPEISDDDRDILRDWVQTETQFVLGCREGLFLGAIEALRIDVDPVRFQFLVESADVET